MAVAAMHVVVGAGIAGLSVAWDLLRQGARVTLVAPHVPGRAGSSVAATGYLEPRPGKGRMHRLERRALFAWPDWISPIDRTTEYRFQPLHGGRQIKVARAGEVERLERDLKHREAEGWQVERIDCEELRRRRPGLAPDIVLAARIDAFRTFDPVATCRALGAAVEAKGARMVVGTARAIEGAAVRLVDGTVVSGDTIVLACGAGAADIEGTPDDTPALRTVRGASLVFPMDRDLTDEPMWKHAQGHLCPRGHAWVAGASFEHGETSPVVDDAVAHDLRAKAASVLPELSERPFESRVGWRVHTIDGGLALRRSAHEPRVWFSLGHGGVGFLRAPVTASLLAQAILADGPDDPVAAADAAGRLEDPLAGR